MAQGGKNAVFTFYINNVIFDGPVNWPTIKTVAFFDNKGVQADITTTSWEFAAESAKEILRLRDLNGRFQGIPFKATAQNDTNTLTTFEGFIDPTDGFENTFDDDQRIKVNMKKKNGLNSFNENLGAIYLDYLESIGVFAANDYTVTNYVVQKKINLFEELVAAIMIFQMVKELKEIVKELAKTISEILGYLTAGFPIPVSSVIYAIAIAIIQTAYLVAIAAAIAKLVKQLIDTFIPPIREHRCLKFRTAMEKIAGHLGYEFISNITELDTYHYLPSNPQLEKPKLLDFLTDNVGVKKGIPNTVDFGNNAADFWSIPSKMFNARTAISGNKIFFYTDNDPFWLKQATWPLPSVRPKPIGDNSGDLKASKLFTYELDTNDRYTVERFKGTSFQVITDLINVIDPKAKCLKGSEIIEYKLALPSRLDQLTQLQIAVFLVKQSVLAVFGKLSGNADTTITNIPVSAMVQSDNWHSKPKVLVLNSQNQLPINHRDLVSARFLYFKFHESDSFVANNFFGQKETFSVPKLGFGLDDYVQLNENSYFNDDNGANGKVVEIDWEMGADKAAIEYWQRGIYDTNLKEIFVEPQN